MALAGSGSAPLLAEFFFVPQRSFEAATVNGDPELLFDSLDAFGGS